MPLCGGAQHRKLHFGLSQVRHAMQVMVRLDWFNQFSNVSFAYALHWRCVPCEVFVVFRIIITEYSSGSFRQENQMSMKEWFSSGQFAVERSTVRASLVACFLVHVIASVAAPTRLWLSFFYCSDHPLRNRNKQIIRTLPTKPI